MAGAAKTYLAGPVFLLHHARQVEQRGRQRTQDAGPLRVKRRTMAAMQAGLSKPASSRYFCCCSPQGSKAGMSPLAACLPADRRGLGEPWIQPPRSAGASEPQTAPQAAAWLHAGLSRLLWDFVYPAATRAEGLARLRPWLSSCATAWPLRNLRRANLGRLRIGWRRGARKLRKAAAS